MKNQNNPRSIRVVAMDLLSRREHSTYELKQKLKKRDFDIDAIEAALDRLQQENLLSDSRFIESIVNSRVNAGFGPFKILYELRQKGISTERAEDYLSGLSVEWEPLMAVQRSKKYGPDLPVDYREKMKQARFLQNRGFSPESVMRLFR
jgi:regulatory protein